MSISTVVVTEVESAYKSDSKTLNEAKLYISERIASLELRIEKLEKLLNKPEKFVDSTRTV